MFYAIITKDNGITRICFDGNKPFISDNINKAKDQANFLKSVNAANTYTIVKLTELSEGKPVEKYLNQPPEEKPKGKRIKKETVCQY